MKIMIVNFELLDAHTIKLMHELRKRNHEIVFIGRKRPPRDSIKFYRYPFIKLPKRPYRFSKKFSYYINAWLLEKIWRRVKPDIVHNIYVGNGAFMCAKRNISPLILTATGTDILNPYQFNNKKRLAKIEYAIKKSDYITADSKVILNICEKLGSIKEKMTLFYFGVDSKTFTKKSNKRIKIRKKLNISPYDKVIFSPRRLVPSMRHHLIIHAIGKMYPEHMNIKIIFIKYGNYDKKYIKELIRLSNDYGIKRNLIFLDFIQNNEMADLYNVADIVINMPDNDGLPVTLIEAGFCQIPVLTVYLDAYDELYVNDKNMFIINENSNHMVYKLSQLLKYILFENKSSEINKKIKSHHHYVINNFSIQTNIKKLERIYEYVLKQNK